MSKLPQPNAGMSRAVQQAMQRRSDPALGQVSQGAAMANPVPQPSNPSDMTQASAPADSAAVEMPKFEPQNRKDLITLALIEQLKNDNKLDKEKMKMATQPMPEPAQASVAPPAPPAEPSMPQQPMGGGIGQPMARNQMQSNYNSGAYSGLNNYGKGI